MTILTYVSIVFLLLEVAIIAIGIVMGYRRATGRSAVRAVYLLLIGLVSFLVGRAIAFRISDVVLPTLLELLPPDVVSVLNTSPELTAVFGSLMGALIVPGVFALLFGLLQLLSLICFKRVSGKLVSAVTKSESKPKTGSKWGGAAIGLVTGFAVSAVLLSPLFTVVYLVDNTHDETILIFEDAFSGTSDDQAQISAGTTLAARPMALAANTPPLPWDTFSVNPISSMLLRVLTGYEIGDPGAASGTRTSAAESVPALLEAAGDALYAYRATTEQGGSPTDAFTNAAAALLPHLDEPTVRQMASGALSGMGETLKTERSVLGFEIPQSDNVFIQSLIDQMVTTLAETNTETVADNMKTLFGELPDNLKPESKREQPSSGGDTQPGGDAQPGGDDGLPGGTVDLPDETPTAPSAPAAPAASNTGLLSALTRVDTSDPAASLSSPTLQSALGNAFDNPAMAGVMAEVTGYAMQMIKDSGVDLKDPQYEAVYEELRDTLTSVLSSCIAQGKTSNLAVAGELEGVMTDLFDRYDFPIDDSMIGLTAQCVAAEFMGPAYVSGTTVSISVYDLLSFFGISDDEMPDWVK